MSYLMLVGKAQGCRAIQDYLIDSFCNGINNFLETLQKHSAYTDLTFKSLAEKLSDLFLGRFGFSKTMIPYAIAKENRKGSHFVAKDESFAVVKKNYTPNMLFQWKREFSAKSLLEMKQTPILKM